MIGNEKEDLTQAQLDERIGELEQRLKVCIRARETAEKEVSQNESTQGKLDALARQIEAVNQKEEMQNQKRRSQFFNIVLKADKDAQAMFLKKKALRERYESQLKDALWELRSIKKDISQGLVKTKNSKYEEIKDGLGDLHQIYHEMKEQEAASMERLKQEMKAMRGRLRDQIQKEQNDREEAWEGLSCVLQRIVLKSQKLLVERESQR